MSECPDRLAEVFNDEWVYTATIDLEGRLVQVVTEFYQEKPDVPAHEFSGGWITTAIYDPWTKERRYPVISA